MRIFVRLERDTIARLVAMATKERRRPQDQAALLIERAIRAEVGTRPSEEGIGPDYARDGLDADR